MPQMSPMMWLYLLFLLTFILSMVMTLIYFVIHPEYNKLVLTKIINKTSGWKW